MQAVQQPATWNGSGMGSTGPSDLVSLSGQWNLVALARNVASPERSSKLASLAAELESGSYDPSPDEISASVIQDHLRG
jgi:hypothetical protein